MSAVGRVFAALCGIALGWCLVGFCGRDIARMPQVVRGEGALAVAFGDARETIGRACVHKADSYFHGGIDMECGHLGAHGGHDHGDCHYGHDHGEATHGGFDPWRWINSHVRAPEVHRHLEGAEAVELMPWLWAGVRADPRNVANWTTAWYVASHMVKDHALAREILREARKANPESMELAFTAGREAYDSGRGDVDAAEMLFLEAKALGERSCGGDLSRLGEHDSQIHQFILEYLRKIGEDRLSASAGTPSAKSR